MASGKFFRLLWILHLTHLLSLMERRGCIHLILARLHSECGSLEIIRLLFSSLHVLCSASLNFLFSNVYGTLFKVTEYLGIVMVLVKKLFSPLMAYLFPFVLICFEHQGLQDKIKLVPMNLQNRPGWYKEKVYPGNKVPSLEHNNEVRGESLDLIKYVDSHFEGPPLLPDDPVKREFAEELLSYTDTFTRVVYTSFKGVAENEVGSAFDYLEKALSKFDDGPFFLGQFSLVDIAYAPFIERFQPFLLEVKKYDITTGRPKLEAWIEEMNKIEAYKQTQCDRQELLENYKKRFLVHP
ncbi:hypothetical protein HHK36_010885 [Tetracentron sinense]|uniref:GST N-terminal domain-containing protein n=1 Tax=Tetracentron sinense TaxID=13715 RepID=A0A834Z858_TETSI|nr:hypothetical protein HHK36_010885 [Tetracentron sinense]